MLIYYLFSGKGVGKKSAPRTRGAQPEQGTSTQVQDAFCPETAESTAANAVSPEASSANAVSQETSSANAISPEVSATAAAISLPVVNLTPALTTSMVKEHDMLTMPCKVVTALFGFFPGEEIAYKVFDDAEEAASQVELPFRTWLHPRARMFLCSDLEKTCLLYTSPSPRDKRQSRMPSSA